MGPQMYDHGFATLALAECYGMVDDKRIAPALKKCVASDPPGSEKQPAPRLALLNPIHSVPQTLPSQDASLLPCSQPAMPASRSLMQAIEKGLGYMSRCRSGNGAYGYSSKGGGRITLSAIGSLCFSLAKKKDAPGYEKTTEHLSRNINVQEGTYPFYFRYYMSQALFQADEKLWEKWNKNNIRLLSNIQLQDGSFAGNHGNAYSTSAALLSLALNYRFLPIYEK